MATDAVLARLPAKSARVQHLENRLDAARQERNDLLRAARPMVPLRALGRISDLSVQRLQIILK